MNDLSELLQRFRVGLKLGEGASPFLSLLVGVKIELTQLRLMSSVNVSFKIKKPVFSLFFLFYQ